jgi:opacity protein-like surface antigen
VKCFGILILALLVPMQAYAVGLRDHLNSRSQTPIENYLEVFGTEPEITSFADEPGMGPGLDDGNDPQHRGPLNPNLNPFSGRPHFLIMPAVTAEHLETGEFRMRFGTNFDSVYQVHDENGYSINADYEITEVYALFDYQITQDYQLGLIIRSFHYAAGRADRLLDSFHSGLGFPTGSKGDAPNNQFSNTFTKNGKTIYETKNNQLGMGDAILVFKAKALDETKKLPALSIVTAVKLPTGNRSLGYRSGSTDVGIGVAATKQITKRWKAHFNTGVAFPGKADNIDQLQEVYSVASAFEYYFNEKTTGLVQFNYSTSPYDYDFDGVNSTSFTVGLGLQYRLKNGMKILFHFSDELFNNGDSDYEFGLAIDLAPLFFYIPRTDDN